MKIDANMPCPSDRCGYTLTKERGGRDDLDPVQEGTGPFEETCCWRETWNERNRCVWHAEVDDKNSQLLVDSRSDYPERFDGVHLKGTILANLISFEDCTINYSDFSNCYLEGANFQNSWVVGSNFENSKASYLLFSDSDFIRCDFSGCHMQIVSGPRSYLGECDFDKATIDGDLRHSDIWHCDFTGSEKSLVDLTGARVLGCDFSESLLFDWKWIFVDGAHNEFTDCTISDFEVLCSSLKFSTFDESEINKCEFRLTDIENSDFNDCAMFDCSFIEPDLYGCSFQNTKVDRYTAFEHYYVRTDRPAIDIEKFVQLNRLWRSEVANRGGESDTRLIEKRIWTHQALQEMFAANSLSSKARDAYLSRKNDQLDYIAHHRKWLDTNWYILNASKYIVGFGEKPSYVVIWSVVVVLLFPLFYMAGGGVTGLDLVLNLNQGSNLPVETVSDYLLNLYFSGLTFSTVGYGDVSPATWSVRFFATIESFFGALLTALLVFVLGRRTTW